MTKRGVYTRVVLSVVVGLGALFGAGLFFYAGEWTSAILYMVIGVGLLVVAVALMWLWKRRSLSR